MSEPFLGEIRIFSFGFAPKGWVPCNGQLLPISSNQALFSLLGTFYGGDGVRTFGLPDLRGRVAMSQGQGIGLSNYSIGQKAGEDGHTLAAGEVLGHTHGLLGTTNTASVNPPTDNYLATSPNNMYVNQPNANTHVTLGSGTIGTAGGSQPHENRQPLLAVNICIATIGIFPSRP